MRRYARYFAVKGAGNFPFYMLHVDQCWPASEDDAEKLLLACPTQASEHTIVLKSVSHQAPGVRMWAERGWPVVRVES